VKYKKLRVIIIFEGRDAAGKGGAIQRVTAPLNQRGLRVVALPAPTPQETSQWYFQRYIAHFPSGGEIVVFDRSWYNRAGVEHVMQFCTPAQRDEFFQQAPLLEKMWQDDGITLIKLYFSVSDAEQERRFQDRIAKPEKNYKLSPFDLTARSHWVDYSRARDAMFAATDVPHSPWNVVPSDDKKASHLNVIRFLLNAIPYEVVPRDAVTLPPRQPDDPTYVRPDPSTLRVIPQVYSPKPGKE
jgi:polyphosphate kinase 2